MADQEMETQLKGRMIEDMNPDWRDLWFEIQG